MDTFSWFPFSIASVLLFGISTSLYKLPSKNGHNKTAATFWVLFSSGALSLIFFWKHLSVISGELLLYAALWGAGWALLTMLQMYALEHVETNTLFPVTSTLSLVAALAFGILVFSDSLSAIQGIGVVLSVMAVYLFLYKKGRLGYSATVLWLGGGIVIASTFNKVIQKFAADAVNIQAYQLWQYLFGTLFALGITVYINRAHTKEVLFSGSFKSGLAISMPQFFGTWLFLVALTRGPFSLITAIHSLYIFVGALAGYWLFNEKLTRKKIALLVLAIIAIILIRLG